jgi:hypothetical protein
VIKGPNHFRLQVSLRFNSGLPEDFVDCFRATGRHSFEAAFVPRARRYRRSTLIAIGLMAGFILAGFAAMSLPVPDSARLWIVGSFAALLPVAVIILIVNLWLRCPGCGKSLTSTKGLYCPMCGSAQYRGGVHSKVCPGCGGTIYAGGDNARPYRIRGCTHCGVFLDEKGL